MFCAHGDVKAPVAEEAMPIGRWLVARALSADVGWGVDEGPKWRVCRSSAPRPKGERVAAYLIPCSRNPSTLSVATFDAFDVDDHDG